MTGLRRTLILIAVLLTVTIGASIPASATFATSVPLANTAITTATVAPPSGVQARDVCFWGHKAAVSVSWTPSSTARVAGYTVTAHRSDGTVQVVADNAATSATHYMPSGTWTYSVTTKTDYGWTAESPRTAARPC
jgi:hypothetical protein